MTNADAYNLSRLADWLERLGGHGLRRARRHAISIRSALDEIERLRTALKFIAADPPDGKYAQEIAKEALAVAVSEDAP